MANNNARDNLGYELMLILPPSFTEAETEEELNTVKELIKELGGNIFSEDIWGIRELAYVIKQNNKGYYAVYYITFEDNEKVKELEKALTIQNGILRSLILKISKHHVIKTHDQYAEEAAIEEAEEEKIKEEKEKEKEQRNPRRPERKPYVKPATEKVAEKAPEKRAPKKEIESEKAAEKEVKAPKKADSDAMVQLSAVDQKLKSLIDDPDISL